MVDLDGISSGSVEAAKNLSIRHFGRRILFYVPSFIFYKTGYYSSSVTQFPSISVTGSSCPIQCKHCGGITLKTMYPATSPEKLIELCKELKEKGAIGCLISGGCMEDGSVSLDNFVDAMAEIKQDLNLTLVVHTGIIHEKTAKKLKKARIEAALIDIIGSDETIQEIYNLDNSVKDYEDSLRALHDAGIPTVPHVLVGLHYGKLKGEHHALKIVSKYNPSAVIIIAFTPIRGTAMEHVQPPSPSVINEVLVSARLSMPSTPLALGCMRPKGTHRKKTDVLAVKAGVNGIAFPEEDAIRFVESEGYDIQFSSSCCSLIYRDL